MPYSWKKINQAHKYTYTGLNTTYNYGLILLHPWSVTTNFLNCRIHNHREGSVKNHTKTYICVFCVCKKDSIKWYTTSPSVQPL